MDHAQLVPGGTKNTLAGGATNWAHQPSTCCRYHLHPHQYPSQFQVTCWSAATHHLVSFSAQQGAESLLFILLSLLPLSSSSFIVAIWRPNSIFRFIIPLLLLLFVVVCHRGQSLPFLLLCRSAVSGSALLCHRVVTHCFARGSVLEFWKAVRACTMCSFSGSTFHSAVFLICRLILYSNLVVLL